MIVLNVDLHLGSATDVTADKAYIQFGGLTAGFAHSFYGIYDAEYGNTIFAPYFTYSDTTNLLAYTGTFGGGISATGASKTASTPAARNISIRPLVLLSLRRSTPPLPLHRLA